MLTVKTFNSPPFGVALDFEIPEGADAIVVCVNNGCGLQPIRLSLPHQIYTHTLRDILKEYPDTAQVTVIPIRSSEYIGVFAKWGETDLRRRPRTAPAQEVSRV